MQRRCERRTATTTASHLTVGRRARPTSKTSHTSSLGDLSPTSRVPLPLSHRQPSSPWMLHVSGRWPRPRSRTMASPPALDCAGLLATTNMDMNTLPDPVSSQASSTLSMPTVPMSYSDYIVFEWARRRARRRYATLKPSAVNMADRHHHSALGIASQRRRRDHPGLNLARPYHKIYLSYNPNYVESC